MTPESSFPQTHFGTYESYFSEKYDVWVSNKEQPMVEAKLVNMSTVDFLTPR